MRPRRSNATGPQRTATKKHKKHKSVFYIICAFCAFLWLNRLLALNDLHTRIELYLEFVLINILVLFHSCQTHGCRAVSYTHLRAHETPEHLVCRLLLEKKK